MRSLCGAVVRSSNALRNRAWNALGNRRLPQGIRRPSAQGRRCKTEAIQEGFLSKSRRQQRKNCMEEPRSSSDQGNQDQFHKLRVVSKAEHFLKCDNLLCNIFNCSKTINKMATSSKWVSLLGFLRKASMFV